MHLWTPRGRYLRNSFPIFVALTCARLAPELADAQTTGPAVGMAPFRTIPGHREAIESVAFLPDGVRIVSGSRDKTVRLWDVKAGKLLHTFEGHDRGVFAVAVSPEGKQIASGSADHTVRIWDIQSGEQIGQLEGHTGTVGAVAFLPDGKLLSGADDGLRLWDPATEKLIWKTPPDSSSGVAAMSVSRDGKRVATSKQWQATHVWDLGTRKEIVNVPGNGLIRSYVSLTPDGKELYCDTGDHQLTRIDVASGKELPLPQGMKTPELFHLTPDGKRALLASTFMEEWDLSSGQKLRSYGAVEGDGRPRCIAVSPDGKLAVCGLGGIQVGNEWKPSRFNFLTVTQLRLWSLSSRRANLLESCRGTSSRPASGQRPENSSRSMTGSGPRTARPCPARRLALRHRACRVSQTVWTSGGTPRIVFFHKESGVLDPVVTDSAAGFSDVVWDGKNIWVPSLKKGVLMLNREGHTIARMAEKDLPPASYAMMLHPISADTVLAAGLEPDSKGNYGDAWLALLNHKPNTQEITAKIFFRNSELPPDPLSRDASAKASFAPRWMSERPSAGAAREIWIGCDGYNGAGFILPRECQSTLGHAIQHSPRAGEAASVAGHGSRAALLVERPRVHFNGKQRGSAVAGYRRRRSHNGIGREGGAASRKTHWSHHLLQPVAFPPRKNLYAGGALVSL